MPYGGAGADGEHRQESAAGGEGAGVGGEGAGVGGGRHTCRRKRRGQRANRGTRILRLNLENQPTV